MHLGFQRPQITQSPVSITVAAGQTAKLKCEASGKPAPNFQWLKDGCDVADIYGVTIATGNGYSTLTINNTQKSHAGEYMCRAFNVFSCWDGIHTIHYATITVAGELSSYNVCLVNTDLSNIYICPLLRSSHHYPESRNSNGDIRLRNQLHLCSLIRPTNGV